jgi:PAS domain S-box-containing protein
MTREDSKHARIARGGCYHEAVTTTPAPSLDGVAPALDERRWALEALSSLGDGVLIADEAGRLVYSNAAAVRLVGASTLGPDREAWSKAYGIFQPDEHTHFDTQELPLVRALAGQPTSDVEIFVRNRIVPEGIHLLCSGCPLRDDTGRVRGATVIFHDVSVRRWQQIKLLEGERQRRAILDNIPDIAWLKDREGRFLAVNSPMAKLAGFAHAEELLGKTDLDLWPRDLALRYRADDDEIMRTGLNKRVEEPLVEAGGVTRWIETFKTRITGDNGEILGTTGIARDITERKHAEQALRYSNDELERRVALRTAELGATQETLVRSERLAVLGQLAGGVAHQIRNPLAAIMNATYVLKRHLRAEQHPNVDDAIGIIHDEVRHANVIITSLLDYARVRTPDRHPTSVAELVERVLSADWIGPSIRMTRAIDEVPLLALDADQLHSALFNLVRNAVEAMPEGGDLRVEVTSDAEHVFLAVTDTGPGIAPQVRDHLFEPLHSTKPMGIGLGLVTARTLVEAHGGRIAHVETSSGTRFEIRLPLPGPPRAPPSQP